MFPRRRRRWRGRRRASPWGGRRKRRPGRRRCAGLASLNTTGGTAGSSCCATLGSCRRRAAPSCSAWCPSPWCGPTTSSWDAGEFSGTRQGTGGTARHDRLTRPFPPSLLSPLQVPAAGHGEGAGNGRRHPSDQRACPHHERRTGCQGEEKRHIK